MPTFNDVNQMRNSGVSDSRIVNDLKHKGLGNKQTYDTMRKADLAKNGSLNVAQGAPGRPGAPDMPPPGSPPPPDAVKPALQTGMPPPPPPRGAGDMPNMPSPSGAEAGSIEEIEEVVETIIDERWKEVTENIKKVIDWKNLMDQKLERMDQEINDLKTNFNELYKALVGKIGDYDKNLLKVGADMKAMEKVFSQVLPSFTENVNELARIAQDIRSFAVKKEISKDKS